MERKRKYLSVAEPDVVPVEVGALYRRALVSLRHNRPLRVRPPTATSADQALSSSELEALRSVGATVDREPIEAARDPVTRTVADYMALLDSSYSTREAARFLDVDVSRIRQRIHERSLFGVEYEGEWRLPRFQLERRRVIPGLAEVLRALPKDLSALDIAEWFLSPNPDLELDDDETLSPRDWLLRGKDPAAVAAIAALI
jgi:hypothetical protein